MALIDQISSATATAMKAGQADRVAVLRLLSNSMANERIKTGADLDETAQLKVVQREAKQRKDSIEQYQKADRADLVAEEQAELAIIEEYLPVQMDQAELESMVDAVIAAQGATSMAQMGSVIGAVVAQAAGRADGAQVSAVVRQKLAG